MVYLWRACLAVVLVTALIAVLAILICPVQQTTEEAPPPPFLGFVLMWPAVSSLALWGVLEPATPRWYLPPCSRWPPACRAG